jgi:hypothetical protein
MKQYLLIAVFLIGGFHLMAQDFSKLASVELKNSEQCKKAESQVTDCCSYILNNPVSANPENRLHALQFVLRWMEATPDFIFDVDESVVKMTGGDKDLLPIYLVGMAKVAVETGKEKISKEIMKEGAIKLLLNYCNNSENGVKPSPEIKRRLKEMNGVEV